MKQFPAIKLIRGFLYVTAVLMISTTLPASPAAPRNERPATEREILTSGKYHWGEGYGQDLKTARQAALSDLITKISTFVTDFTQYTVSETESAYDSSWDRDTRTAACLSLQGWDYLSFKEKTGVRVLAYISKDKLADSFTRQKGRIRDLVASANDLLEENLLGPALRDYYWAYLLSFSLIDSLDLGLGHVQSPVLALSSRMRKIAAEIDVRTTKLFDEAGATQAILEFFHKGNPVRDLDFQYYNGEGMDFGNTGRNGREYIQLFMHQDRLILTLFIARPGEMKAQPDIIDIHKARGNETLDLILSVELRKSRPPIESLAGFDISTLPGVIRVLLQFAIPDEFLKAMEVFAAHDRLFFSARETDIEDAGLDIYLGIMDDKSVKTILRRNADGLSDLKTGTHIESLSPSFKGLRVVYLGVRGS